MISRFQSQPHQRPRPLILIIGLGVFGWSCFAVAANQDRLTPEDIAVAEPLQVPLSAAKPTPEQPAVAASQPPAAEQNPAPAPQPDKPSQIAPPKPTASVAEPKPKSGWLGLTVDDSLVTGRLVIVEVADPSPAQGAGVRPQDVLLAIDGEPIQTADQLAAVLAAIPPQKQVRALIGRTDGVKEVTMEASVRPATTRSPTAVAVAPPVDPETVAVAPPTASRFSRPTVTAEPAPAAPVLPQVETTAAAANPPSAAASRPAVADSMRSRFGGPASQPPATLPAPRAAPLQLPPRAAAATASTPGSVFQGRTALGVRTVAIDAATQARYRLPEPTGAYVLGVVDSLPASRAGLPPGSVIVAFDNRPIRSPAELNQLVTESPPGRLVALEYVLPGGEARRADIELQALEPALERALLGVPSPADDQGTRATPQAAQRPIAPAQLQQPLDTPPTIAPSSSDHLLRQEIGLLREEVLRLRNRLDELERPQPVRGRSRGDTLR